ncbi:MAG TPA: hypothetical protein P5230_00630 [Candidatus Magasanikbacteria bacterium]|nr:hypothetical protein [Candidatus Magasanikbacteria bacterium]
MRRKDLIKDVKIVEPPIHELNKGSHGLRKSCFFGCSFFLLLIIGLLIGVKFYIGSGPKTVTVLPLNFPLEDIPIYNKDKVTDMTFISGEYKSRRVELAAIFPKIVLLPFLFGGDNSEIDQNEKTDFKNLFQTIAAPVTDKKDNFKLEWQDVDNNYNTFVNYYKNELQRRGFVIDASSDGAEYKKIDFSRHDGYAGTIYAENKSDQRNKTTYAFLMLNMPPLKK